MNRIQPLNDRDLYPVKGRVLVTTDSALAEFVNTQKTAVQLLYSDFSNRGQSGYFLFLIECDGLLSFITGSLVAIEQVGEFFRFEFDYAAAGYWFPQDVATYESGVNTATGFMATFLRDGKQQPPRQIYRFGTPGGSENQFVSELVYGEPLPANWSFTRPDGYTIPPAGGDGGDMGIEL